MKDPCRELVQDGQSMGQDHRSAKHGRRIGGVGSGDVAEAWTGGIGVAQDGDVGVAVWRFCWRWTKDITIIVPNITLYSYHLVVNSHWKVQHCSVTLSASF